MENQATDRAYRIGQTKDVFVHYFITEGTLEEHIDDMLERKESLKELLTGGRRFFEAVSLSPSAKDEEESALAVSSEATDDSSEAVADPSVAVGDSSVAVADSADVAPASSSLVLSGCDGRLVSTVDGKRKMKGKIKVGRKVKIKG